MRSLFLVALMSLASCGGDDTPVGEARWQLLGSQRPSSLLAVWSSGPDDVWVVGGREGMGVGPTVFHYDGAAWTKLDTGEVNVDLWQVFGFRDGPVFLGGSNGVMLRYQDGAFERIATPSTDIVFGLWGSTPDDVWAVGGQTTGRPFVWRYRGTQFEAVPGIPAALDNGTVWKVTGRAADDVWMSASRGLVLRWDGQALASEMIGTTSESLFSIGCTPQRCVSAGTNISNGVLYEHDGSSWISRVPTADGPVWRGVAANAEQLYVVGMVGAVMRYARGSWVADPHGLSTEALHAAWVDPEGNLYAVGGKFDRAFTTDGVLLYKGELELPPLP